MRENAMLAKWRAGEATYGCWLSIPSSFSAEVMAHQGYDYVCIDMQHGLIDYQVAVTMLQAISTTNATPICRVPWNEMGIIGKMLDAGAMGIVIPMVNSVEEAKAAVAGCRYFPDGSRSFGPARATYYSGSDYFANANNQIACIPMIETGRAVDKLDEILAVPGIDAVYVGPADLSITLGQQPRMDNEGAFEAARLKIAAACKAHGIAPGIHANAQLAAKHTAAGYQMITISGDAGAMATSAGADVRLAKGAGGVMPAYR